MRVIGMWLRIDLRRRWRSLAVLGLLIVLAGVIVVAFVAGARRGTSAVWVMLAVGPAALLVANLLAAWPGQRAAKLRIAQILRTE